MNDRGEELIRYRLSRAEETLEVSCFFGGMPVNRHLEAIDII